MPAVDPAPERGPDVAGPALVTVHVWGVEPRRVPAAVARMALHRRPLRSSPGALFAKLFGTGDGRTFTARDADPLHWGAVVCWRSVSDAAAFERGPVVRSWARIARETLRLELRPLASRGRWGGHDRLRRQVG